MDKYRIDSHKLLFHVSRINDWLNGKLIYPIYVEVSASGACNHRCTFCALDYMGYKRQYLNADIFKKRLTEMGSLGVKGIMYGGEGEPLLHEQVVDMISHTKDSKIDVAITTNGVLLNEDMARDILDYATWIKVSIGGGTRETYSKIHRTRSEDFDTVVKNMSKVVKIKAEKCSKCTLGMQIILLPENHHEVILLARLARDIGMDYLVVKPYSKHLFSKSNRYKEIKYGDYMYLSDELKGFNTDAFSVIFRMNTMKKWDVGKRNYNKCLALPFWSYIDAGGNVYGCSAYLSDARFFYGNIYENSFKEIWEGEMRQRSSYWVEKELDTVSCRVNCRMDEINRYLWDLKNPPGHVNFI